jgi:hypothetical protein
MNMFLHFFPYIYIYIYNTTKEVDLEVNIEKTKYMLVSWDQNAGQNREIKIGKKDHLKMCHGSSIWERQ